MERDTSVLEGDSIDQINTNLPSSPPYPPYPPSSGCPIGSLNCKGTKLRSIVTQMQKLNKGIAAVIMQRYKTAMELSSSVQVNLGQMLKEEQEEYQIKSGTIKNW